MRIIKTMGVLILTILFKILFFIPRLAIVFLKIVRTIIKLITDTLNFFMESVEQEVLNLNKTTHDKKKRCEETVS